MRILFVVMNMKNTKRMRTFFLGALVLSTSAWIGGRQYYLKLNEKEQEKIIEVQEAETEQFEESVESANIQNKKAFVVREEDGYLNVYFGEEDTLYMHTGIAYQGLPEELKKESAMEKPLIHWKIYTVS